MDIPCQVDFYVLARPGQSAEKLACRLAMKAWQNGHRVMVQTRDEAQAIALDEMMWDEPPGRFLPHSSGAGSDKAPVSIQAQPRTETDGSDLLINLTAEPVTEPQRFRRLLEIVPAEAQQRAASRLKFKAYRDLGLEPVTHTIGKN